MLFNIKLKNFFFGSLLGFAPQVYIFSALGSGLEKQIEKNIEPPSFLQMITSLEIYAPILGILLVCLIGIVGTKRILNKPINSTLRIFSN